MPTYAVTGAGGHFGRRVIGTLLARDVPAEEIVAIARTPEKVADLSARSVDVRQADYTDPPSLAPALAGVRRLLLVSGSEVGNRVAEHTSVIEAAQKAGVERIVYTSILNADTSKNPLAPEHQGTEAVIRASGLPYTLLRNGWYTENYTIQTARFLNTGEILGAAGSGRISAAPRNDYADAAATALTRDDEGNAVYELGGQSFTFDELARALTAATGIRVLYRDFPAGEYAQALQVAGERPEAAGFIAAVDESIRRGELETDSDDLARLLGRAPTPLADAIHAAL
jgi:uncharacterized protein YbjT (DUF2867 family)